MSRRMIVVDDGPDTVDLLATLLRDNDWEIVGANSIAEARTRINAEAFELIILESWLPDGDGVDFCRELRSSRPGLPILFLSGAAFPADITEAAQAGCDAYLVKPCDIERLTSVVDKLVSLSSDRQVSFQVS